MNNEEIKIKKIESKFNYYLFISPNFHKGIKNDLNRDISDLILYNRFTEDISYQCIGFENMTKYIVANNIDFKDIRLKDISFYDLFIHFVDYSSLPFVNKNTPHYKELVTFKERSDKNV